MKKSEKQLLYEFYKGVEKFLIGKDTINYGVDEEDFIQECGVEFTKALRRGEGECIKNVEGEVVENVPGWGWETAKNKWKKLLDSGKPLEISFEQEIKEPDEKKPKRTIFDEASLIKTVSIEEYLETERWQKEELARLGPIEGLGDFEKAKLEQIKKEAKKLEKKLKELEKQYGKDEFERLKKEALKRAEKRYGKVEELKKLKKKLDIEKEPPEGVSPRRLKEIKQVERFGKELEQEELLSLKSRAFSKAIVQNQMLHSKTYNDSHIFEWLRRNPPVEKIENDKLKINRQSLFLRMLWFLLQDEEKFRFFVAIFEGQKIEFPSLEEQLRAVQQSAIYKRKQIENEREQYYLYQEKKQRPELPETEIIADEQALKRAEKLYKLNRKKDIEIAEEIFGAEKSLKEEAGKLKEETERQLLDKMRYLINKEKKYREDLEELDKLEKSFRDKEQPADFTKSCRNLFYRKTGITILAAQFLRILDYKRKRSYKERPKL